MLWLGLIAAASAASGSERSVRATVELGPDGPVLLRAAFADGAARVGPGPLEVLAADGSVLATAALPDARERSIIFPEGGGAVGTVERAIVRARIPWPEAATAVRLRGRQLEPRALPPSSAVPIYESGPPSDRLDLVILGDGYTSDELDDFVRDVDDLVAHMRFVEPYDTYRTLLNIWRVDVASTESGSSHPELLQERDTALGCAYNCSGIQRLVCCDEAAVVDTVEAAVPGADGILVLVNDPIYGGAGGQTYATAYTGSDFGPEVATHELGHSLVGLWDEYGYGYDGTGEGPNCSAFPDDTPWEAWKGSQGIDAFQECSYTNHYRPTLDDCMMRTLESDYCAVCRERVILSMYSALPGLVQSVEPEPGTEITVREEDGPATFDVVTNGPTHGLGFEWSLDGAVVHRGPDLDLQCSDLDGSLTLRVFDDTEWVRTAPDGFLEQTVGPWEVKAKPCDRSGLGQALSCGCASGGGPALAWLVALPLVLWRRR